MKKISPYGTHRVVSPAGVLPQAADVLNNEMKVLNNEILISVKTLNIDSASFTQIKEEANSNIEAMKAKILEIVGKRGKMQNPVTGSGGMLLGVVKEIGSDLNIDLKVGDKIATLVSLSLTPLKLDEIISINLDTDQVEVVGEAILFETGIYAKIPSDLDESLVLSALDVAGAPAQVEKLVKKDDSVLIIGAAGKSGILCAYQARKSAGPNGLVIGMNIDDPSVEDLRNLNVCDEVITGNAQNAIEVYEKVMSITNNKKVDVTINVVNVPNTEMSAILVTRPNGIVYFFSMATSFTKAALGAEGVASESTMIIGNGYTPGHAELTLNLLRESKELFNLFKKRYSK